MARRDAEGARREDRGGEDSTGPWASLLSRPRRPGPGSLCPFSLSPGPSPPRAAEAGESLPGPVASLSGVGPRRGPRVAASANFLLLRLSGVGRGLDESLRGVPEGARVLLLKVPAGPGWGTGCLCMGGGLP